MAGFVRVSGALAERIFKRGRKEEERRAKGD
jgi:hypothetical protein